MRTHLSKAEVFAMVGYEVRSQEVADFHNSTARRRVVSAPARTSKSFAAAHDILALGLPEMVEHRGRMKPSGTKRNWLVGPDYGTDKEFQYIWEHCIDRKFLEGIGGHVSKALNSPNQGNMIIVAEWGKDPSGRIAKTIFEGKSATNERALQGEQVHACGMSEAAEQDERIWTKYLRTRCGTVVFPTTPKVKARWLYNLMKGASVEQFTFRPQANPDYDYQNFWEEHAAAEAKYAGRVLTAPGEHECLLYSDGEVRVNPACRAAEDPDFAEQFLGQWTFQMGKVLPFVAEPGIAGHCHVVEAPPPWIREARWFWSFDYGYDHPTVGLLWAVGPAGQLTIWDSFYESKLSDPEIAERIREREEKIAADFGARVERYSGDPKRPEVKKLLQREMGISVIELDKGAQSDRAAGHRALVNALKPHPATGIPGLTVYGPNCPQVVEEWDSLCVKEGKFANEWGTSSLDGADHAFDAAKYGIFVARFMQPKKKDRDWYHTEYRKILRSAARRARGSFEDRHVANATGTWGTA